MGQLPDLSGSRDARPMKRAATTAAIAAILISLAGPAGASEAPTAKELVRQLVKAGVCTDPISVGAGGRTWRCTDAETYVIPTEIEIHAYTSPKARDRSIDRVLTDSCTVPGAALGIPDLKLDTTQYLVGRTWWTYPYRDLLRPKITKAIGGKLRTVGCPK